MGASEVPNEGPVFWGRKRLPEIRPAAATDLGFQLETRRVLDADCGRRAKRRKVLELSGRSAALSGMRHRPVLLAPAGSRQGEGPKDRTDRSIRFVSAR